VSLLVDLQSDGGLLPGQLLSTGRGTLSLSVDITLTGQVLGSSQGYLGYTDNGNLVVTLSSQLLGASQQSLTLSNSTILSSTLLGTGQGIISISIKTALAGLPISVAQWPLLATWSWGLDGQQVGLSADIVNLQYITTLSQADIDAIVVAIWSMQIPLVAPTTFTFGGTTLNSNDLNAIAYKALSKVLP